MSTTHLSSHENSDVSVRHVDEQEDVLIADCVTAPDDDRPSHSAGGVSSATLPLATSSAQNRSAQAR